MLGALSIKDIVLIDRLELTFSPGLSVLTGETGAGKSILLDALGLALGGRADRALIRAGAERAVVSAVFEPGPSHAAWDIIRDQGLEIDPGEPLILRRILDADGRSRAFVNDAPVGVGLLRDLGDLLVEIHGQHDDRGLLNPAAHRRLLDAYGGLDEAAAEHWGLEEGTDEIPQYYLIQCILCMAVTDLPEWDVAALIGGSDFRIYTIHRDIELETTIIERLLEWWDNYIVKNQEPEVDSSESCAEYLAAKYPRNFKPLKQADETTEQLLSRLAEIRDHLKSYEEQEEAIKNLLKNYIGDADGVQGVAGKATWIWVPR